jgi:hypothetical protein
MFQPVEVTRVFLKNMHDDIAQIQKDPFPVLVFFFVAGLHPVFFQAFFDAVTDRDHLPVRSPVADNKIIAKIGDLPDVQNNDIPGFFIRGESCDQLDELTSR